MTWEELWYEPSPARRVLGVALAPFAAVYGIGVGLNSLRWRMRAPERVDGLEVVSVGNLVVGGAGKTPVTIFLARWAAAAGQHVAILTRGYGRESTEETHFNARSLPPVAQVGDEPRLIARRCPGVDVWVGADRVSLARAARAAGATFAILDDGFQHRRLARDVDLVVRGGEGTGHLLPWGPMREPLSAAARAQVTWLRDGAEGTGGCVVRARHLTTSIEDPAGQLHPSSALKDAKVSVLTGLARPRRLITSLTGLGAKVVTEHVYPDHHVFTAAELDAARSAASSAGARLVTTEKDRERLPPDHGAWVLRMDVQVDSGLDELAALLGLSSSLVPALNG